MFLAIAIGNATQIKVGYYVGAHQSETAYRKVFGYQLLATACSMVLIAVANLCKPALIGLFTREEEIRLLTGMLLAFSVYIELGRSLNLVYIGALKGAGTAGLPRAFRRITGRGGGGG